MKHFRTPWSCAEIAIVKAHPTMSAAQVADLLPGRSAKGVCHQRLKMGYQLRQGPIPFTAEEDAVITGNPGKTIKEIRLLLPHRSYDALKRRRIFLVPEAVRLAARASHKPARPTTTTVIIRRVDRVSPPKAPKVADPVDENQTPIGVPFRTSSGLVAIRLGHGVSIPFTKAQFPHLDAPPPASDTPLSVVRALGGPVAS